MAGNRQGDECGRPSRWEILDRTEEAACRVFSVVRKLCRHPVRGREDDFYVLESSDWVNVVAVTPDGRMVLVEQYRFGSEELSLEVPGGLMDLGENPIETAERELREETGFVGRRSRLLGSVRPNPAIQSNQCHIVLIEEAERLVDIDWDENEELAVQLTSVAEVYAMAHSGKITHALALNALFLFQPIWLAGSRGDLT
jgi:8-oxo-dGTP pyrophosphatase MutT (NUDIX family)